MSFDNPRRVGSVGGKVAPACKAEIAVGKETADALGAKGTGCSHALGLNHVRILRCPGSAARGCG